jgi:hypothetical protein
MEVLAKEGDFVGRYVACCFTYEDARGPFGTSGGCLDTRFGWLICTRYPEHSYLALSSGVAVSSMSLSTSCFPHYSRDSVVFLSDFFVPINVGSGSIVETELGVPQCRWLTASL